MVHLVDWARDSAMGQVFELASSLLNDDRIARQGVSILRLGGRTQACRPGG
jgi:hypothetical protein